MKCYLKIIFTLIFFMTASVNAQMMRMDPKERADNLKEKLKLNEEQTKQIEKIYIKADNEFKEIMKNVDGDREQMREIMETRMKNTDNEILNILNEEQKIKYNDIILEMKKRRPMPQGEFN